MPLQLHTVHKMQPIATDVARSMVCVSVCVLVTLLYCTKLAEPIYMLFWELTLVGLKNHVLGGGQDWMNPFTAARGEKSTVRPFIK